MFSLQTSVLNGELDVPSVEFLVDHVCDEGQELVYLGWDEEGDDQYICSKYTFSWKPFVSLSIE